MTFNPFEKNHNEQLTPEDLQLLVTNSVREGYVIEYKRELPANPKVANSIASFANTYGGWYVVGIGEENGIAKQVTGFDSSGDPISRIREVVKSHIDPTPVIHPQAIILPNGRIVIATYIPSGLDTPHITRDGRVYRRVVDSSDPIPETDRHALDQMVKRGQKPQKRFERFCADHRTFSEDEGGGWANIYLSPYPQGIVWKAESMLTYDLIDELMGLSRQPHSIIRLGEDAGIQGNLPFNAGQLTHESIILRQVELEGPARNTLHLELFFDGSAKIFVPIREFPPTDFAETVTSSAVRAQINLLYDTPINDIHLLRFFDAGLLACVIVHLVSFYERWLGTLPDFASMLTAAELVSVWRMVPFADVDEWATHVNRYGLPIMSRDNVSIGGRSGDPAYRQSIDDRPLWRLATGLVFQALGIPTDLMAAMLISSLNLATTSLQSDTS